MGQLRNEDNVTINEVTVSHRALKNSPHDACTWDPHGIRGVSMDGGHWYSNESTVVRSVNVSIGGVSFECDAGMLDILADPQSRKELVQRSLQAQAEKEALEASLHDWVANKERSTENGTAWQCKRCTSWVVTDPTPEGAEGLPIGGCIGRPPTDQEKQRQNAQAAVQAIGRQLMELHERARMLLQNEALPTDVVAAFGAAANIEKALAAIPIKPNLTNAGAPVTEARVTVERVEPPVVVGISPANSTPFAEPKAN